MAGTRRLAGRPSRRSHFGGERPIVVRFYSSQSTGRCAERARRPLGLAVRIPPDRPTAVGLLAGTDGPCMTAEIDEGSGMVTAESLTPALDAARANTELSKSELHTLELLYETLIAPHEPKGDDDPALMRMSAKNVSLVLHALVVINKMERDERSAVRLFLRLLENRLVTGLFVRIPRPFSAMSPAQREKHLQRLF